MNIREDIRRHLVETDQVMQTRRFKWLFAIGLILLFASSFHVFEPEYWQMRRVLRHIADISPQWAAFKRANPGFEAVELFPRYDDAYGVRFAAKGMVPWSVDLQPLAEFMNSTRPPFPVDIFKVTTDFSDAPRPPVTKKVPVMTPDGRRIEVDVPTEPYPGSDVNTARSKAEPGGPSGARQLIPSKTNSTPSAARPRP